MPLMLRSIKPHAHACSSRCLVANKTPIRHTNQCTGKCSMQRAAYDTASMQHMSRPTHIQRSCKATFYDHLTDGRLQAALL